MRYSISDIIALVLGALIIAGASVYLALDMNTRMTNSGASVIGTVSFKKRAADRRFGSDVIWDRIEQRAAVYANDSIKTGADSEALITLADGTVIGLDEESMITISPEARGIGVTLSGGSVRARSGGAKPLTISASNTQVRIGGAASVSVSRTDAAVSTSVKSGSAEVRAADSTVTVAADETAVTREGVVKTRDVLAVAFPLPGDVIITTNSSAPVDFKWSSNTPAVLTIARDTGYRDVVLRQRSSGALSAVLAPGSFHWRVAASDAVCSGTLSVVRFQVLLRYPLEGRSISPDIPTLTFSWDETPTAGWYVLELARDAAFKDIISSDTTKDTTRTIDMPAAGTYRWRVRAGSAVSSSVRVVSEQRSFTVTAARRSPPELTYPPDHAVSSNAQAVFGCSPEPRFDSYRLIVTGVRNFTRTAAVNFIPVHGLTPGVYSWHIEGLSHDGPVASSVRTFTVSRADAVPDPVRTNDSNQTTASNSAVAEKPADTVKVKPAVKPVVKTAVTPAAQARLQVNIVPAGATVLIASKGGAAKPLMPSSVLAPGAYTVTARADGYVPFRTNVSLAPGEENTMAIAMKKKVNVTERVILLDDTVISGKIVKQEPDKVRIDTDDGVRVIKRDEIQNIEYLKNSQRYT